MYERKRCVLLADDEVRILRALSDLLSANGFHVLKAENGREALEAFTRQEGQIDLVLLDVMMPDKDGFSVLREIRSLSPRMPVILLTARGRSTTSSRGFNAGRTTISPSPSPPPCCWHGWRRCSAGRGWRGRRR